MEPISDVKTSRINGKLFTIKFYGLTGHKKNSIIKDNDSSLNLSVSITFKTLVSIS